MQFTFTHGKLPDRDRAIGFTARCSSRLMASRKTQRSATGAVAAPISTLSSPNDGSLKASTWADRVY
jgi:hypothetical protein